MVVLLVFVSNHDASKQGHQTQKQIRQSIVGIALVGTGFGFEPGSFRGLGITPVFTPPSHRAPTRPFWGKLIFFFPPTCLSNSSLELVRGSPLVRKREFESLYLGVDGTNVRGSLVRHIQETRTPRCVFPTWGGQLLSKHPTKGEARHGSQHANEQQVGLPYVAKHSSTSQTIDRSCYAQ